MAAPNKGMLKRFLKHTEPVVFLVSGIGIVLFLLFGALFSSTAESLFAGVQSYIVTTFGWFYTLTASASLVFVLWLLFSRYGDIRLGPDDSKPRFSYLSWFAMLFSAGMGIGLVYYGVAEPVAHYLAPPTAGAETVEAAREAMRFTFFHWGFHPWAIYIIVGLALAYFHFRHDLPMSPRSIFYPLLGERIYGPIGHTIDILAVIATLFGLATSLGLGVMQFNTGLNRVLGVPESAAIQVVLIIVITLIATASVVSGLDKGIRMISEFNIGLASLLLLFVLFAGPTVLLLEAYINNIGDYLQNLIALSTWTDPGSESTFMADWTLFYWGWWISWAPFVGLFIARISRGRTIREFILGVLVVPTLVTFLWLNVFGETGLYMEFTGAAEIVAAQQEDITLSLYTMLEALPLATLTSSLFSLLIVSFFVTSSDSGSFVVNMITTGGNDTPPKPLRVFWALAEGAVAAVLLVAGGLEALQTGSITTGLPMAVLLIFIAISLTKALHRDAETEGVPSKRALVEDLGEAAQPAAAPGD